jgi:DNA polymerase IV (archaeal DinB-like DNA polymerase)
MRIVALLDLDAFFASVEEHDKPRLRGRPLVIGADPEGGRGRGVVSTASYRAREYGIRSAMPISEAWERSEAARRAGNEPCTFLEGNFRRYSEVSHRVMDIIRRHAPVVEQASVDEAYFEIPVADGTSEPAAWDEARRVAKAVQQEILAEEGVTASIGVGPNKLIAKVASDVQKPNGITVVTDAEAERFLEPLAVRKIPGVGPKTEALLAERGVRTVRDLKRFTRAQLTEMLGKWGDDIYERARGRDDTPLITEWEAKSVGEQETFRTDTLDIAFVSERLTALCAGVFRRFTRDGFTSYRTVVLTVRFAGFETKNRSHTLAEPANDLRTLQFEAMKLLIPFAGGQENPHRKKIRLIGVRVEKLA